LSALFRGKFLDHLKHCFKSGDLAFPGSISHLKESGTFDTFRKQFYEKKWVVYCKPPFGGPEGVLKYLGRYTHRIAISNNPSSISRTAKSFSGGGIMPTATV